MESGVETSYGRLEKILASLENGAGGRPGMSANGGSSVRLRRVGAVLAGFLTVVVLSVATDAAMHSAGVFPPLGEPMSNALFALALAYRVVYTIAGGWVTARLAPDLPMRHVLALGIVGTAAGLAGAVAGWNADLGPRWYPISLVVTALPCCWAGGKLFLARVAARLAPPAPDPAR